MNRIAIAVLATLLTAGCASFQRPQAINTPYASSSPPDGMQPAQPATEEAQTFLQREIGKALGVLRADIQNSMEAAIVGGDEQGRQCHAAGLAYVDSIRLTHVRFTGIVSIAEDIRLKQLAVRRSQPLWDEVGDKCAAIYPIGAAFRHLHLLLKVAR